ncbi:unnamed protein product, partial [Effrenium voratum]
QRHLAAEKKAAARASKKSGAKAEGSGSNYQVRAHRRKSAAGVEIVTYAIFSKTAKKQ